MPRCGIHRCECPGVNVKVWNALVWKRPRCCVPGGGGDEGQGSYTQGGGGDEGQGTRDGGASANRQGGRDMPHATCHVPRATCHMPHAHMPHVTCHMSHATCLQDVEGQTPLHLACRSDNVLLVRLLLKHSAATDETDCHGRTALMVAVRLG